MLNTLLNEQIASNQKDLMERNIVKSLIKIGQAKLLDETQQFEQKFMKKYIV